MADENTGVKISLLPTASNLADADVLAGVQSNVTKKFSLANIKAFVISAVTAASIGAVPTSRTVNGYALSSNVALNADDVGAAVPVQTGSVAFSTSWSSTEPYTQTVTVTGVTVTVNSKVDIQLSAAQIMALVAAGVTGMVIENNNGTLTAYCTGATPSGAMTVQVTVTEVS